MSMKSQWTRLRPLMYEMIWHPRNENLILWYRKPLAIPPCIQCERHYVFIWYLLWYIQLYIWRERHWFFNEIIEGSGSSGQVTSSPSHDASVIRANAPVCPHYPLLRLLCPRDTHASWETYKAEPEFIFHNYTCFDRLYRYVLFTKKNHLVCFLPCAPVSCASLEGKVPNDFNDF